MKIQDAIGYLGRIDNMSGQVCKLDSDGKPTLILFDLGCPHCSEVAGKSADGLAAALVTLANAAPALLAALTGLVGAESEDELRAMESVMRLMPAPDADKTAMLNAIHVLLST